jgi:hypothetical protein
MFDAPDYVQATVAAGFAPSGELIELTLSALEQHQVKSDIATSISNQRGRPSGNVEGAAGQVGGLKFEEVKGDD